MRNNKTAELVLTALFAAIIMAFTPLGYIPLVVINATIIHIPVILGSLFCGPKKGGFLGFIFGLTSFIKNTVMPTSLSAFVFSPVLAASMVGTSIKSASTAHTARTSFFCLAMVGSLSLHFQMLADAEGAPGRADEHAEQNKNAGQRQDDHMERVQALGEFIQPHGAGLRQRLFQLHITKAHWLPLSSVHAPVRALQAAPAARCAYRRRPPAR